jgi:hypothetical protein
MLCSTYPPGAPSISLIPPKALVVVDVAGRARCTGRQDIDG